MIHLILFNLKNKLWNRKYVYKLVLIFIIIGVLLHLDILLENISNYQRVSVSLDESVSMYKEYFKDTKIVQYVEDADIRIVFEDDWKIYSDSILQDIVIQDIQASISTIPGYEKIENLYDIYTYHSKIKDNYLELIVYTILYFTFLSKSVSSIQEIIEEKLSGISSMYLTCINPSSYITSKILEGWIVVIFEYFMIFIFGCIWAMMRYGYSFNTKIIIFIQKFIILEDSYFRIPILIIGSISLLIGIYMIQYVIVLLMCKVKSIDEANHMIMFVYGIPIIIYYLAMAIYDLGINKLIVFVPFLQSLLLPMSLSYSGKISTLIIVLISFELIYLYICMKISKKQLRKNILNIEKSYVSI